MRNTLDVIPAWTGKIHCVTPWLDHGVQLKILIILVFLFLFWIPRSSRGMTIENRSTQQCHAGMTLRKFFYSLNKHTTC
ncbi:MAG: hypothetical protein ACEY3D_04770 [Rickettsia sp.]|uniref:hypothetical protein n=1 Tax=Rickettsia sp. TaxID=789 RepID=UPI00397BCB35